MNTSSSTPSPPPPFLHGIPLPPPNFHFHGTIVYVFLQNKRTTPDAIKGLKEVGSGECTICLEDTPEVRLEMPCGHAFGKDCLTHWLEQNNTCPMCRKELPAAAPWFMQVFVPFHPPAEEEAPAPATTPSSAPTTTVPTTATPATAVSSTLTTPITPAQEAPRSRLRHHPYRPLLSPSSDCDMGSCGLCTHDGGTVSLECGHTYHQPCLQSALSAGSYQPSGERVRCELCRQYKHILP